MKYSSAQTSGFTPLPQRFMRLFRDDGYNFQSTEKDTVAAGWGVTGFTLIELLVAVALVAVVSIVGFTATNTAGDNQLVRQSGEVVADTFQRASIYSQNARDERSWGVRSQDQKHYVIISQLTDGSEFEELQAVTLPSGIQFTQPFHILFTRGTNYVNQNHDIGLTTSHNSTAIVSLTTSGKITVTSP